MTEPRYGKQADGSWLIPVMPLRKDHGVPARNQFGRARSGAYRKRQAEFRGYLLGMKVIPRERKPPRKNVRLDMVLSHKGYSAMDKVTAYDFLCDVLQGIAFEDDWQVCESVQSQRLYTGKTDSIAFTVEAI